VADQKTVAQSIRKPLNSRLVQELVTYLEQFILPRRQERFRQVLSYRTAHIRIVLEDIYQEHNASAVLRSCDCFGVQHVHFIENRNRMRVNDEVAMGSSAWLDIHRHREAENNTTLALRQLKQQGYRIVCTSPHQGGFTAETLPVDKKFALVFGTELEGVSQEAQAMADDFVAIPMFGFTESFNISVCAALCMYDLVRRIHLTVQGWQLSETERAATYLSWLKASIDQGDKIAGDFLNKKKS
jgi:tRNA (guanosine-2'-O-)-methyltransferase